MKKPFLLTRIVFNFDQDDQASAQDLSAVVLTPDGHLWTASDESQTVERFSQIAPATFGDQKSFTLSEFITLPSSKTEIDLEGVDYADHYLWLTGSHGTKRKNAAGDDPEKDLERLATVETEENRYLLARIPLVDGKLAQTCPHPKDPATRLTAASLKFTKQHNTLMEALSDDPHIGAYIAAALPGKENGFDIEGLTIAPNPSGKAPRVLLGLREPVLRGWALILEIQPEEEEPGELTLSKIGPQGERYQKYFFDLHGLGMRDICVQGDDLLILAGPTMALEATMPVVRVKNFCTRKDTWMYRQQAGDVATLFDLPVKMGTDHAEGITRFPCLGEDGLLVVYDSPDASRQPSARQVFADVFRLPC